MLRNLVLFERRAIREKVTSCLARIYHGQFEIMQAGPDSGIVVKVATSHMADYAARVLNPSA